MVKSCNAAQAELHYVIQKFPTVLGLIDISARHVFSTGMQRHILKCVYGFNHHAVRDNIINPLLSTRCDFCGVQENWEHVLLCPSMASTNKKFINTLSEKLCKLRGEMGAVRRFLKNLDKFLKGHNDLEGTQAVIGYKFIF